MEIAGTCCGTGQDMDRPEPDTIPLSPGVYIYKDAHGRILYVGKAKILRRRVLSYFRPTGLAAKTVAMLKKAVSIEYFTTNTEKEALLLEASLIKKHRPPYNIVLRDDKNYVLFRLNTKNPFPRLEIVRRVKKDGASYFGPFTSALAARETWKLVHRAFPLRRCNDRGMKNRVRPCLYHHMGQCPAPCMGLADKKEYAHAVHEVRELLSGNSENLLNNLRCDMEKAAEELEFEKAARLRDQIKAVTTTVERQAAILPGTKDMDAVGVFESEKGLAIGVVFLRNGAVGGHRSFFWPGYGYNDAPDLLSTFLNQFYMQASPPPRILLPWTPSGLASLEETAVGETGDVNEQENFSALEQLLAERRGGQVRIVSAQNDADNRLIDLAQATAREEARRRQDMSQEELLENLQRRLQLKRLPERIECVDVSHTFGRQTRVGMVVYLDGLPEKSAYRIYNMPDSADDYATLYEWVARRLESGPPWPDLLLVDGGKGQLASVLKGLEKAGQSELFNVAAIAKARDENGHADRRAGNVSDRIFTPGRSNPMPLREASPELLFLQQIRDATHQFAISGHRKARRNAAFSQELMRLPGVGPVTARLLWDKFGSIEAMRNASEADISSIPGFGARRARMIREKLQAML